MRKKRTGEIKTICGNPNDRWVKDQMIIVNRKIQKRVGKTIWPCNQLLESPQKISPLHHCNTCIFAGCLKEKYQRGEKKGAVSSPCQASFVFFKNMDCVSVIFIFPVAVSECKTCKQTSTPQTNCVMKVIASIENILYMSHYYDMVHFSLMCLAC